jgi:hypothetical protein
MGEKAIGTAVYGSIIKEQLGVNNIVGGEAAPVMQAWHLGNAQTVSIDKWR